MVVGTFTKRTLLVAAALGLVHSGLRIATGTAALSSFFADLTGFGAAILALASLAGGIAASRYWNAGELAARRQLVALALVGASMGAGAYGVVDQIAPRFAAASLTARASDAVEPAASTSEELRLLTANAVARARTSEALDAPAAWQEVNRLVFEHDLRIVQSLLLPVMALIGLLAGSAAERVGLVWRAPALWGLAGFLAFSMFMSGENGYEMIILRSAGPMGFVAWLQGVVPGCVLIGLGFAHLPSLLTPRDGAGASPPA